MTQMGSLSIGCGSSARPRTPDAHFTASPGANRVVTFTDQSVPAAGATIVAWFWNFGDNTVSTVQNPVHTYVAAGSYSVSLQVTDSIGALSDTFSLTVTATSLDRRGQGCLQPMIRGLGVVSTLGRKGLQARSGQPHQALPAGVHIPFPDNPTASHPIRQWLPDFRRMRRRNVTMTVTGTSTSESLLQFQYLGLDGIDGAIVAAHRAGYLLGVQLIDEPYNKLWHEPEPAEL